MGKRKVTTSFICLVLLALAIGGFYYLRPKERPSVAATKPPGHKTVCLNMIVKNEHAVIERCLASVLPLIDSWVIVDTGSTDGTQGIIKEFMKKKGVPGELLERPWKNFSHNRNEAMQLARGKADYLLLIDADEYIIYDNDFSYPVLDKDYYYFTIVSGGSKWTKLQLLNNHQEWAFAGVLHEVISPPYDRTSATMQKLVNVFTTEGFRSKNPQKYQHDAEVLEAALKDEPNNSRYYFYMAESYKNANNPAKAIEAYTKRAQFGPENDSEVFLSLLEIARAKDKLDAPSVEVVACYTKAITYNRARAEPFYHLTNYYRRKEEFEKGYQVAKIGVTIPLYKDILWVEDWMYQWGLPLELSVCAYWSGRYQECQTLSLELLKKDLPPHVRECVERNLGFANQKLLEQVVIK